MPNDWGAMEVAIKKAAEQKIKEKVDRAMLGLEYNPSIPSIVDAGRKLVDVINSEIDKSSLSPGQREAIPEFKCGTPCRLSAFRYGINVSNGIRTSPSLDPESYGGITDLTLLFNDGVDHIMKPVHGYWHGREVWSRTNIPAAHFLENAKSAFDSMYSSQYHIVECELHRR